MNHQLSQHFTSAEKIIFSNYRSTLLLRNLFAAVCVGLYLLVAIITLNFPVSNLVLFGLIAGGIALISVIHCYTCTWASCFIKSETLICKHLNRQSSVIPIYSIKEVKTKKFGVIYLTTVSYRLDGKNQKVRIAKRTYSNDLSNAIQSIKESLKKANL